MLLLFKRTKFSKPLTNILLTKPSAYGAVGDIVQVTRQEARNRIVPLKFGYYFKGKLPEKWEPIQKDIELEEITPFEGIMYKEEHSVKDFDITEITLERFRIGSSNRFFGSVSADTIQRSLQEKQVNIEKSWISLKDKIKEFGDYSVEILMPKKTKKLKVRIVQISE